MATLPKRLTIIRDDVVSTVSAVEDLVKQSVLIGFPDSGEEHEDSGISMAAIGYYMETGLPEQNVPARPFLVPGVKEVEDEAVDQLRVAAAAELNGDNAKVKQALNAAGLIALTSVKNKIGSLTLRRHSRLPHDSRQKVQQARQAPANRRTK